MLTSPSSFTCSYSDLDLLLAPQQQQAALRQRGRDLVRRLRHVVRAEVFGGRRQRVAEMEVRRMRGVDHDRQPSRVRGGDDSPSSPTMPK